MKLKPNVVLVHLIAFFCMLLDTVAVSRKHAFQIVARAGPKLATVAGLEPAVRLTGLIVLLIPGQSFATSTVKNARIV